MPPFSSSIEHLVAELDRASGVLQNIALARARKDGDEGIADDTPPDVDAMTRSIEARLRESVAANVPLRLRTLTRAFGLTRFDVEVILFSLLPEVSERYASAYARLQQRGAARWPSVDLVLEALCSSYEERIASRARFMPHAPLLRHQIIELVTDPIDTAPALPSQLIKVDPRVAGYLFESDAVDPKIEAFTRLIAAPPEGGLILPSDLVARLERFIAQPDSFDSHAPIIYLEGPYGAGKQSLAEVLCQRRGVRLLVVRGAQLAPSGAALSSLLSRVLREARLLDAAIYWEGADALLDGDDIKVQRAFLGALSASRSLMFLGGQAAWEPDQDLSRRGFLRVTMPRLSGAEQARVWAWALGDALAPEVDLDLLTGAYRLTGGQIRDAAATAQNLAAFRGLDEPVVQSDLRAAARLHSNRHLTSLGRWISPRVTWDDLVSSEGTAARLREICWHVRHRGKVMDGWGFDRKLMLGKGVSVLFSGPPGTGKTMAASVMASELGLDLYHVDLSAVISKYIGETERNLAKLFDEAEVSNAILFFDEADTLFSKRTEVKDAHDRNANLEASYMLQRMESYEGMSILASNLTKNMDEAFVRRIRFVVEMPYPTEAERRRLWARAFPAEAPLGDDIDVGALARQVELAGGYIRNIALRAAFAAAEEGSAVAMRHVLSAAQWEYQKIGKIVDRARFNPPPAKRG